MAECSINRDWIMTRLQRETHRQLRQLADYWHQLAVNGDERVPFDPDKPLSLDAVVRELIRRDHEHRERGRKNTPGSKRQAASRTATEDSQG